MQVFEAGPGLVNRKPQTMDLADQKHEKSDLHLGPLLCLGKCHFLSAASLMFTGHWTQNGYT